MRPASFRPILCGLMAGMLAAAPVAAQQTTQHWGAIITDRDRSRLRDWRGTWVSAVNKARAAGAGAQIDAEGDLLKPDAGLEGDAPPQGDYRCRLLKIGGQAKADPNFLIQNGLHCRIEGHTLSVLDGPQRPIGRFYPLDDARRVFLGALTLGDEENVMRYRRDPDRNVLGLLERIGPNRWRLGMPAPKWQSMLDVLELVPAKD